MDKLIIIPILLPIVAGAVLLGRSFYEHRKEYEIKTERGTHIFTGIVLVIAVAAALLIAWSGDWRLTACNLVDGIPIYFHIDGISRIFVTIVSLVWLAAGAFSVTYMKHEGNEKRYFGFFLMLYGVLVGLNYSGNLVTLYLFYELMTLVSFPLVLHNGSREAIMASLKYLFYSMCGAYAGLFGIFFLYKELGDLSFVPGGMLSAAGAASTSGSMLLIAVFCALIGFGAKAGMFPLHAWLPAAHPVAPSPASACMSGIIVKGGVLAIIRIVYYVIGPEYLRGTWVQYAWMTLTLITVFMGSMLAFREKVFKKRLAYSTVSQVSYILFGLSVFSPMAFTGAIFHTVAHALIKCGLFLTAGVFIYQYGYTRVEQLKGLGKKHPVVMWCYTFFALALVGIPPTGGFISKWYLAEGAMNTEIGFFSWFGPAVLIVSALLTAGYLIPITLRGFFPGEESVENATVSGADGKSNESNDVHSSTGSRVSAWMAVPLIALAVMVVMLGVLPNRLVEMIAEIISAIG